MAEFNFKPFDKVLVRDSNLDRWECTLYSRYEEGDRFPYRCMGSFFVCCIPYEGNEHLLGTTDPYVEPIAPYKPQVGDFIVDGWEMDGLKCEWIAIIRTVHELSNGYYDTFFDMFTIKAVEKDEDYRFGGRCRKFDKFRLATEEEKQLLLSKLAEIGKEWNPKKKCIEDVYQPKDGDFVAWGDSDRPAISIFREGDKMHFSIYVTLYRTGYIGIDDINTIEKGDRLFRPATESEKQLLLDKLHKEGKDWDESKKEIVEYRWKPEVGEHYFTVFLDKSLGGFKSCETTYDDDATDSYNEEHNLILRTEKESDAMADKLNQMMKGGKK